MTMARYLGHYPTPVTLYLLSLHAHTFASGQLIATGCSNGDFCIVNTKSGDIRCKLTTGQWVRSVAFGTGFGGSKHVAMAVKTNLWVLDVTADGKVDIAPWRIYKTVLEAGEEEARNMIEMMCTGSPSFQHRRAPEWLHGLTVLHFAALFGKLDHARTVLEHGADKHHISTFGETALGFIFERGNEPEVRAWLELLGDGAPVPPETVIRTIIEKIDNDTTVVEMLLDAGLVQHRDLSRLQQGQVYDTLGYMPSLSPRVLLSSTAPQGLYGHDSNCHDCTLHLDKKEFDQLMQPHASIADALLFQHASKTRVTIRGCVYAGICNERVMRVLSETHSDKILMHDVSNAVVCLLWSRCRGIYCLEVMCDILYIGLLMLATRVRNDMDGYGTWTSLSDDRGARGKTILVVLVACMGSLTLKDVIFKFTELYSSLHFCLYGKVYGINA